MVGVTVLPLDDQVVRIEAVAGQPPTNRVTARPRSPTSSAARASGTGNARCATQPPTVAAVADALVALRHHRVDGLPVHVGWAPGCGSPTSTRRSMTIAPSSNTSVCDALFVTSHDVLDEVLGAVQ